MRGINGMPITSEEDWMQYAQHYIAQKGAMNHGPRMAKVAAPAAPAAPAAQAPLLGLNGKPLTSEADWNEYTQQYIAYMQKQGAGAGNRVMVQVPAPAQAQTAKAPASSAARATPAAQKKKGWFW
jgi:hypothetical protein